MSTGTTIRWKLIIIYGLVGAFLISIALYLLHVQPFRGIGESAFSYVNGFLSNPTLSPVVNLFKENWTGIAAAGAAIGIPTIAAVINQVRLNNEKKAAAELAQYSANQGIELVSAHADNKSKDATIGKLTQRVAALESDPTADELQKSLSTTMTENQALKQQLQAANDQYAYTMQQLAHGATEIKDAQTGDTIKIVEKTVVK